MSTKITTHELVEQIKEDFDAVYEAGYEKGKAEGGGDSYYDAFWDAFQNKGDNPISYYYAFAYGRWNDSNYNPKYPIKGASTGGLQNIFYNTSITDTKVPIDSYNATHVGGIFYQAKKLVRIPRIRIRSKVTGGSSLFTGCASLEECYFTEDSAISIDWDMSPCVKLNKQSIVSVINALSASASSKTATFNKTAVNTAFTTEEWNALAATKPNWTFSLL